MKQSSQGQGLKPALLISTLLAITVSNFELFRMEMNSHVQEAKQNFIERRLPSSSMPRPWSPLSPARSLVTGH
jgi:hypothetical protein